MMPGVLLIMKAIVFWGLYHLLRDTLSTDTLFCYWLSSYVAKLTLKYPHVEFLS
jgi:hypothetical protein